MSWHGKKYSPYKLCHGDFLSEDYKPVILDSDVVFANNLSFGPEVDLSLKKRFAEMKDGSKIVSGIPKPGFKGKGTIST